VEDASADDVIAADANVLALYFGDLPQERLLDVAGALEASPLVAPVPCRMRAVPRPVELLPPLARLAPSYHETIWPHLGWMHCIGLARLGLPWRHRAAPLVQSALREGSFLETLDPEGRPHVSRYMATERDFTMGAGLCLELDEATGGGAAAS
jgi:hypothetical protein